MINVTMPCIALRHLSRATLENYLLNASNSRPFMLATHDNGVFLTVAGPDERHRVPKDLQDVFNWADDKTPFGWIMLDIDGDAEPGLPLYPEA